MADDEKRICLENGKAYTFDEFEIEFCHVYSASEIDAKWEAMKMEQSQKEDKNVISQMAPSIVDPGIVKLAEQGNVAALEERLRDGCAPDVLAFEYARQGGSKRVYCNDWTPICAATVAGQLDAVLLLLGARGDVNVICETTTASGSYKSWTALDCARTGELIPFERDPSKHLQPRHPRIEKALLAAGAKPASSLPPPLPTNTFGNLPQNGERPNPCVDADGESFKPDYLFTEAELRQVAMGVRGVPVGVGSCVMPGIALQRKDKPEVAEDRVYYGGSKVYR